jgi:hypothetical protein
MIAPQTQKKKKQETKQHQIKWFDLVWCGTVFLRFCFDVIEKM